MNEPINILAEDLIGPVPPLNLFKSFNKLWRTTIPNNLCRNANSYCIWRDIVSHNSSATYNSTISDFDFVKYLSTCGNPDIITYLAQVVVNSNRNLSAAIKQLIHTKLRHCGHLMVVVVKSSDINIPAK